jgi:hypothetical protein
MSLFWQHNMHTVHFCKQVFTALNEFVLLQLKLIQLPNDSTTSYIKNNDTSLFPIHETWFFILVATHRGEQNILYSTAPRQAHKAKSLYFPMKANLRLRQVGGQTS